MSAIFNTNFDIFLVSYKPLKWLEQWTESLLLVPSLFRVRMSHHLLVTQNVFVQFDNPKEGHFMEYWFSVGFLFYLPLGKSASITSIYASFGCAFISRAANLTWRTKLYLALGVVDVFVFIFPKTYPDSWTGLSHVLIGTPFRTFSIRFHFLERNISSMSTSFVMYLSVKPCG